MSKKIRNFFKEGDLFLNKSKNRECMVLKVRSRDIIFQYVNERGESFRSYLEIPKNSEIEEMTENYIRIESFFEGGTPLEYNRLKKGW